MQHGDMKSSVLRSKKTQPFCKLGVLVHCLARTCEIPTIPTDTKMRSLCTFCGCNCKTSKICHQRTKFFTIGAE